MNNFHLLMYRNEQAEISHSRSTVFHTFKNSICINIFKHWLSITIPVRSLNVVIIAV